MKIEAVKVVMLVGFGFGFVLVWSGITGHAGDNGTINNLAAALGFGISTALGFRLAR